MTQAEHILEKRRSGILLPIFSLPSPFGIGDMGPEAYRFADFLCQTRQGFWQILPLHPTDPAHGNSPYQGISAFAGSRLLISPELLLRDGLLSEPDLQPIPDFPQQEVDYLSVIAYKDRLFHQAYENFQNSSLRHEYEGFCSEHSGWLDDFALFVAIKEHFQGIHWEDWPAEVRERQPGLLATLKKKHYDRIEKEKFLQYIFFKQWLSLKQYCNEKGIRFFGDIPIYVVHDSVEVWKDPEIFNLDEQKLPISVAGVPPDYFSETGQLWGNPVYRWDALKERGYDWWIRRMEHNLKIFDLVRIDHFRGFVAYWEVQAGEETAINGKWVPGPADDFFTALLNRFSDLPIIAEDLGTITPDVKQLMQRFGFPGMKILLFAFGEDLPTNPYVPHNHVENCIVYTGTHDNNTVRGWFENEVTPEDKKRMQAYLGRKISTQEIHWEFVRLAMMSVAALIILPIQDILGLGEEARMNLPATGNGNWKWRLSAERVTPELTENLLEMTELYGRA